MHILFQARFAQQYGALGLILYSDPGDYAQEGADPEDVYPHTWWLPGSGTQRGRVSSNRGEATTPEKPANSKLFQT